MLNEGESTPSETQFKETKWTDASIRWPDDKPACDKSKEEEDEC